MASPWGKMSWADDSEAAAAETVAAPLPAEAFPSLGEASKAGKKKKPQPMALAEFNNSSKYVPNSRRAAAASTIFNDSDRLTTDEMQMLPKGPKDRSDEDPGENLPGGRLGGAFRDYGGYRDRENRDQRDRGDRGGGERGERGFGFGGERDSRADDSSDWSVNKPSRDEGRRFGGGGGGGGGRGFDEERRFGGDRDLPSKADEVDNWTAGKKFTPSESRRSDDFGRGGFGKADADDNWGANKRTDSKWSFRRDDSTGPDGGDRWNRGRAADDHPPEADRWSRGTSEEPRRPRLNLQPRTLPVDNTPPPPAVAVADSTTPTQTHGSRPSSSHSSRPGTPEAAGGGGFEEVKPRRKLNPFGDAKPREVLLEERGQDWRKMDLQREVKRPEHEEEKKLRDEISYLKELLDTTGSPAIVEQITEKEQELEELSKEMDSKARVSDKWGKEDSWRRDDPPRKEDSWRRDDPPRKDETAPPSRRDDPPPVEGNAWNKRENGRDRAKLDRW